MLTVVTQIDETVIHRLSSVYSESMDALKANFGNEIELSAAYGAFLRDFVQNPKQLIIAEAFEDDWVSALRAIETTEGRWFLEAVETKPSERQKGYGKDLLHHTIDYLKKLGMTEITCTISKNNYKSRALHETCGFLPTNIPPFNCWGELEDGTILYRLEI